MYIQYIYYLTTYYQSCAPLHSCFTSPLLPFALTSYYGRNYLPAPHPIPFFHSRFQYGLTPLLGLRHEQRRQNIQFGVWRFGKI
jgi:hypothetical protein